MNFPYRRTIPIILSSALIFAANSYAANRILINDESSIHTGNNLNNLITLNSSYDFRSVNSVVLPNGKIKHRITQYYLNVPVWGVSLAVTQQNGLYSELYGHYLSNIEKDVASIIPKLSQQAALNIAMKSKKLSVQMKSMISNEEANIYIIQDKEQKARLVYQISFMIDSDAPTRPHFIMDANTGEILDQWEGLATKNAIGPGGNQKTGQYNYGTDYGYLIVSDTCQTTSPNVDTYDLKTLTSGGALHKFDCTGNPPINTYKLTNGAFSPINDAHYFGNVVFNMYKDWFNKSPLTMKLKLRVHYGKNYENAFWDGQQMTFGDGATRFYPLVSMDVVGHEVSHGFTQQNSNLTYSKQPGGINEAFSDMAGEATEYYNNANKPIRNDWLVGAYIMKSGVALRYFEDPTKDGRSIGHASQYRDGLDVHYSSGVFNKAYYTLAHKASWNTEKAFRAFVLANQTYWNQSTNFVDGGCGVKKAAQDLGYNTQDVIDSFKVVGVDASCGGGGPTPDDTELKNGTPIANVSATKGEKKYWFVNVPADKSTLTIKTSGGTGDADLYVNFNTKPTTTVYQCRSHSSTNTETCTITSPQTGKYWVMLNAYSNFSGLTLSANY